MFPRLKGHGNKAFSISLYSIVMTGVQNYKIILTLQIFNII